jgi:hypothetical protein
MSPRLIVRDIVITERPVRFRHPFRFGVVTVEGTSEAVVHADIEIEGRGRSRGASAELMVPKWFNKNPALTADQTVDELRTSLARARDLYLKNAAFDTAFGLHAAAYRPLMESCTDNGIPPLAAVFGAAEIDKAILDALLRALDASVFDGLRRNVVGLDPRMTPDIGQGEIDSFLAAGQPPQSVFVRHTVGLADSIESLEPEIRAYGLRYFKIKLSGNPVADRNRLSEITQTLDALKIDYRLTLDANEQYPDIAALRSLVEALLHDEAFAAANQRLIYIEQPLPRETSFSTALGDLGKSFAFIIDEADSDYDAFPKAVALGYRGISTKSCKGLYKSLLNGARAARWNAAGTRTFVAAEDLTCQAGLAVQQDTALAAFHGIVHCERNGHHYGDGFAAASPAEARAFLAAHPDLYEERDGQVRLRIAGGMIGIDSLGRHAGFASGVGPDGVGRPSSQSEAVREYAT